MKFPDWLRVYGDIDYRGECPTEAAEQAAFFARIRAEYPDTWGKLALHPKNEGKRRGGQFRQLSSDKALGLNPGASDIIIPVGFACELKRKDHSKCRWQPGQLEYLKAVHDTGGFACVALGWEAAWCALEEWIAQASV